MASTEAAANNATAQSYKQLKEDFVSNLSGGSVTEIAQVCAVAPVVALLWSALQARQSFFKPYTTLAFAVDFLLNVGALLLSVTLYSSAPLLLNILLLTAAAFVSAIPPNVSAPRKRPRLPPNAEPKTPSAPLGALSTKPFLTNYRGNMMVVTCICILAVDFRLFPRRFAKVETWGTSLMDMGVGSFVFSAGVVASRPVLKEQADGRTTPLGARLVRSLRHSLPLLALGVVRLLSVKGLDYAEHVTEYGVHWNFFFTLGFLPPFVALFQSALKVVPSYAGLAILLGVLYQVVLESTALKAYILVGPRDNLLSMNREGIFSFWGYLAIFLAGQDTGMFVLPRNLNPRGIASSRRTALPLTMAAWSAVWIALYFLCTDYTYGAGLTVSRRLANLPYMLWVVAFNTTLVLAFCLVDTIFFPAFYKAQDTKAEKEAYSTATSKVLRAYNRNGLAVFLLANLLTGLVNMTVPTLDVGRIATIGILVAYMGTLTAVAVGLDMYDITIKL
ncbi:GPI-anchored wall transfer protein 1 [Madurella mycetomatis]|uniref:GPI-anchored wall transfer protein n=1 Tax=Madurella mycetomatis TaxID=100816 RepID=A0A175VPJ5_9PEZI|nr:GPI-anchored wall transfer protein 1 [Madurella mycetomatis]WMI51817.1 GPI-anchored wall transfer protein 1 [Madurella mycetomatis]WMI51818.1 GPI-anchored wall transfer protein 1 [Madurella mycetomatis]WMI51819.1 GPI-anchored wall transfer protein 1 [Madurella mycetomatis]WMI51820.1 GPI-anchored wall transfer protein 1 [Madurella mycetomatis]